MAGNSGQNRNNQASKNQAGDKPQDTPPVAADTSSSEPPAETATTPVVDTVVLAAPPVETPPEPEPVATPEPVADEPVEMTSTTVMEGDTEQVQALKPLLAAFVKAANRPGNKPEEFKQAAKLAAQFTKYVIQFPKVPVLDAFLAFFKENINGVCDNRTYMKGGESLPQNEQQQVGFLHGLFADLARGQVGRVNSALVINVLKKTEILDYYNRKVSVMMQTAAANQ